MYLQPFNTVHKNVLRETHLLKVALYANGTSEYLPYLDNPPHPIRESQFSDWWEIERIFRDGTFSLTRKKLTFALRNLEGGSHYAELIRDPNYVRFSRTQVTTPVAWHGTRDAVPILGAELASMRQIAWELRETLIMAKLAPDD